MPTQQVQTCKTIIFEEFNRDVDDLYTILENADDPNSNKLVEKIEELSVSSFAEFMKKFAPKVYEVCQSIDGKIRFFYTFDKEQLKNVHCVEREIADQVYFQMLSRLYAEKGTGGSSNLKFNDDEILDMLTPKQEIQAARNLRKKLEYNLKEYYRAQEKGENTEEFSDKIKDCRRKIISQYSGTQSTLIPILIEDLKTKRKQLTASKKAVEGSGEAVGLIGAGKSGELYIDGEGRLQLAPPKEEKSVALIEQNPGQTTAVVVKTDIGEKLSQMVASDYDKKAKNANDFVKSLIVSTYAPTKPVAVEGFTTDQINTKLVEYDERINELEEIYCKAKENFINEFSQIIESLMGVKIFFDHATVDGGETAKLPESVIIANCKVSKLLGIEDKFKSFIKHRGKDQIASKIWFAILPNVMEKNLAKKAVNRSDDPMGDIDEFEIDDDEQDAINNSDYTSVNSALKFLQIMKEARIVTVMNIRQKAGNTFADLTVDEVREKMSRLPNDNPYAVYAYPNFTLTRERPGFKPFKPYSERTIALPGIYIDAAYPAAGLLVASQQPNYLEKHGFKGHVNRENVCVRIDFEREDVKKNLVTKFNRESELRWSEALRTEISRSMFGFVFCSDEVYDEGKPIKNSYVFCARSLQKNKQGFYRPIYQTLMEDYVAQCLNAGISHRRDAVDKFIRTTVREWSSQNNRASLKDNVNLILLSGEDIVIDEEQKKVVIKFINDESTVDDFSISSEDVANEGGNRK